MIRVSRLRTLRKPAIFVLTLLAIEFLDEFAFGSSWRVLMLAATVMTVVLWLALSRQAIPGPTVDSEEKIGFLDGVRNAIRAVRRREVLRWIILLEFSDLMLDILYSYIALY